jgi:hypothetical protein
MEPPVVSALFGSNNLLSTLISYTLCISILVRDQVSPTNITTDMIIVLGLPLVVLT